MVEPRGFEPLSESNLERVSPGAVCYLHSLIPAGTNTLRELVASLFMVRAKLSAHTVSTQITPEPGSWTFRGGWAPNQAAIATELLSVKFKKIARFIVARRHGPLLQPHYPRRNQYGPGNSMSLRDSAHTVVAIPRRLCRGIATCVCQPLRCNSKIRTARRDQAASWAPDRFPRGCLR